METKTTYRSIKNWKEDDRPREKLLRHGKSTLSDAELIAILIGSGTKQASAVEVAKGMLAANKNKLTLLSQQSVKQLSSFKGIGNAKAIGILAALELGKRRQFEEVPQVNLVKCSKDAYDYFKARIGDLGHEEFWVLYLNNANKIIHDLKLSQGGITGTLVDVRLLIKEAVLHHATGIILAHNHPSSSLKPSRPDREMTERIKKACAIMDINLLDHLIVTEKSYFSFADNGFM